MEVSTYAPVLIPTLNRYDLFKQCVESLSKCTHAAQTELLIGLDYPPSDKYIEGWKLISDYVDHITGFKRVVVFKRQKNMGETLNTNELKDYARQYYDRYIFTEDDNEFSPNFLDYLNKALEVFKDNPRIFGVCGHHFAQIDMAGYEKEYYYSHEMSGWGWGSWFNERCDRIQNEVRRPGYLMKLVKNVPFRTFLKDNTKRCNLLFEIGQAFIGDGYYTYYQWNNDMYCVFPRLSLVRNMGHDGSGLHCNALSKEDNIFVKQEIDSNSLFDSLFDIPVQYDDTIKKKFNSFQAGSFKKKCQKSAMLVLMKMFVKLQRR